MIRSLRDRFHDLSKHHPEQSDISVIMFEIDPFDFKEYLDLKGDSVFYFQDSEEELLAIGSCKIIALSGPSRVLRLQDKLQDLKSSVHVVDPDRLMLSPRVVGGITFAEAQDSTIWKEFSPVDFFLPHLLFHSDGNQTSLIISYSEIDQIFSLFDTIQDHSQAGVNENSPIKITSIEYPVTIESWKQMIDLAHDRMDVAHLNKVVLSRVCEIETEKEIFPISLMNRLEDDYSGCYQFYYQKGGSRFFGASPELLVKVKQNSLSTVALAGTRPRGMTKEQDEKYIEELLGNAKEREEHQLVVDNIVNQLERLGTTASYPSTPSILTLSNVLHLQTKIRGKLKDDTTIFDVIEQFHPTPALGGKPREAALDFIKTNEDHARGLYGGPVGWFDLRSNGKLIVAIRSAINRGKSTWLYAGAGIMRESDYQKEWDEIELKFKPILQALGVTL